MAKRIQQCIASALSALILPMLCFATPTFAMPLVDPPVPLPTSSPQPTRMCLLAYTEANPLAVSDTLPDTNFDSCPASPIQNPDTSYCTYSTTAGYFVGDHKRSTCPSILV